MSWTTYVLNKDLINIFDGVFFLMCPMKLVWNWSHTPWVTINKNIAKEILPLSPKTQ